MKRILTFVIALVVALTLVEVPAKADDSNITELQNLINEGKSITDSQSASAFVWINKVLNFNEKYPNSFVYDEIKSEATTAKGYSSISLSNKQDIILGYLLYMKDEINEIPDKDVDGLLTGAASVNDYGSPDAYKWLIEVEKSMKQYEDFSITSDIQSEVRTAKGYSSISLSNKYNIIVGYLSYLQDLCHASGNDIPISVEGIGNLISEGNKITAWNSPAAYKWLVMVESYNEFFSDSSVYSSLKGHCSTAKGYSSVSLSNMNNIILADLMILQSETPVSVSFNGIEIESLPKKTVYNEGECFDPSGMVVNAIYQHVYSDGTSSIKRKKISNYTVDTTTAIAYVVNELTGSYTEGGVTKTVKVPISINSYLVSETLKSIEIVQGPSKTVYKEGETFSKYGMRVNAVYDQIWSDDAKATVIKENVEYTVDTSKKLTADDTSVTVSVTDGVTTISLEQPITVESYIISTTLDSIYIIKKPNKVSYVAGERFNKTGMVVSAKYKTEWSNGYVEYTTNDNVTTYAVNTTSPLKAGTKKITVSLIEGGIKKTTDLAISVSPKGTSVSDSGDDADQVDRVEDVKLKAKSKKITVTFGKVDGAKGYQIEYALNKKMTKSKKAKTTKKTSITIKNLKKGKTYYVRVRAYKLDGKKKVYGKWSSVKKIKVKK